MNEKHLDMQRATSFALEEGLFQLRFLDNPNLPSCPRKIMTAHRRWPTDRNWITTNEGHGANSRPKEELSSIPRAYCEREAARQNALR